MAGPVRYDLSRLVREPLFVYPVLMAACVLAFWPTFSNDILDSYDDMWQLRNHYTEGGLAWDNLKAIFTHAYATQYSPIDQLMYTLLYYIDGYNGTVYHTASLALHAANAALVYALLRDMQLDLAPASGHDACAVSLLAALVFAVHPVQVESVAWISASKVVLSSTFYLLATKSFIGALKQGSSRHYMLTMLWMLLAFCSKEQTVVFPVWATMLCFMYCCRVCERRTWLCLLPLYMASLVFGLVFSVSVTDYASGLSGASYSFVWWKRIVLACHSLFEYARLLLFPVRLNFMCLNPAFVYPSLPTYMIFGPFALCLIIVLFQNCLRNRHIMAGIAFLLIHLMMVLHIMPLARITIIAERYLYLSVVGFAYILAWALCRMWRNGGPRTRALVIMAAVLLVSGYAVRTCMRTECWGDMAVLIHDLDGVDENLKKLLK